MSGPRRRRDGSRVSGDQDREARPCRPVGWLRVACEPRATCLPNRANSPAQSGVCDTATAVGGSTARGPGSRRLGLADLVHLVLGEADDPSVLDIDGSLFKLGRTAHPSSMVTPIAADRINSSDPPDEPEAARSSRNLRALRLASACQCDPVRLSARRVRSACAGAGHSCSTAHSAGVLSSRVSMSLPASVPARQ